MTKLPDIFGKYFKREGVVYAVNALLSTPIEPSVGDALAIVARGKPVNEMVMRAWLREQARIFKEQYFEPSGVVTSSSGNDDLQSSSGIDRIEEIATDELKELFRLSYSLKALASKAVSPTDCTNMRLPA